MKKSVLWAGVLLSAGFVSQVFAADLVKVNCADATTLSAGLHNIGDAKAADVVSYRESKGLFKTADDLAAVPGIGEKTVEANRDRMDLTQDCAAQ